MVSKNPTQPYYSDVGPGTDSSPYAGQGGYSHFRDAPVDGSYGQPMLGTATLPYYLTPTKVAYSDIPSPSPSPDYSRAAPSLGPDYSFASASAPASANEPAYYFADSQSAQAERKVYSIPADGLEGFDS